MTRFRRTFPIQAALAALTLAGCNCDRGRVRELTPVVTNTFTQSASQKLDVLLVFDNSIAMAPYQQKVAANVASFVGFMQEAQIDYQIAVTTGDAVGYRSPVGGAGRFAATGGTTIVRPTTPNPVLTLQRNLQLGNAGSNVQLPLNAAMLALGLVKAQRGVPPAGNEGFVRAGARLAIIFVTVGDDHMFEIEPDQTSVRVEDFQLALRNLKGPGNLGLLFMQGVLFDGDYQGPALHRERLPTRTCGVPDPKKNEDRSWYLTRFLVNTPFNSRISSICGDSLDSLRDMGIEAAGFTRRFKLSQTADGLEPIDCDGTFQPFCVTVEGTTLAADKYRFDVNTNELVFDQGYTPPSGREVLIRFAVKAANEIEQDADGGFYARCASDAECPAGVACSAGTCHITCSSAADCRPGFGCDSKNTCSCLSDASCSAGRYCSASGACQQLLPCQLNSDCRSGERCEAVTRRCVAAGTCVIDRADAGYFDRLSAAFDCDVGTACNGTSCVSNACFGNIECGLGQSCECTDASCQMGRCTAGCLTAEQCCLGQTCTNRRCVSATVGSLPLCDLNSCAGNDDSQCRAVNGSCVSLYSIPFGCVPAATSASTCAKGYALSRPRVITMPCTLNGNECTGGRVCPATVATPSSTCSCLSDADCAGSGYSCIDPYQSGTKFCYSTAICSPALQCDELFHRNGTLCDDSF